MFLTDMATHATHAKWDLSVNKQGESQCLWDCAGKIHIDNGPDVDLKICSFDPKIELMS